MVKYKGNQVFSEELIKKRDGRFSLSTPDLKSEPCYFSIKHTVYGEHCCIAEVDSYINEDTGKNEWYVLRILTAWGVRQRGLAAALVTQILEYAEKDGIEKVYFRGFVFDLEAAVGGASPEKYKEFIEDFSYDGGEVIYDLAKPMGELQ